MKKLLLILIIFTTSTSSYALTFLSWGKFSDESIPISSFLVATRFLNNIILEIGMIVINANINYVIIGVLVALIMLFLLKAVQVLVSLKELQERQEQLLKKNEKRTIF